MAKKNNKDKVMFYWRAGRVATDSRDVYYWLFIRNKKIAEEWRIKFEAVEKDFQKRLRELENREIQAKKDVVTAVLSGNPEPSKGYEPDDRPWYKKLFS